MIADRCIAVLITMLAVAAPVAAQERAMHIAVEPDGDVQVTTELIVKEPKTERVKESLAPGSRPADVKVIDLATGRGLVARVDAGVADIDLGRPLPPRAEQRIALHQRVRRNTFIADAGSDLQFAAELPPARVSILLPVGYAVDACSIGAQFAVEAGRAKLGLVNTAESPLWVRIHATKAAVRDSSVSTTFRAEDDRSIVYWLDDPASHRIKLALELLLTRPGQAHAYSVLRKDDNISEPVSLDVDRGAEMKTRVVTGSEANAIGDSPTLFAPDAAVLVADLGYAVPQGGSARVRLYQTATDPKGYRHDANGILVWDRFLARLRTRAVLPAGWALATATHPAQVHRDEKGRIVLDFTQAAGDSPSIMVTAVPASDRAGK